MSSQPETITRVRPSFLGQIEQSRWPLWVVALVTVVIVAIRVKIQSIVIDEGDTFVYWISGTNRLPWTPNANNHLLNTYLIWLFTHLFGLNNFSMRLPAFLGMLLYLAATYRFCISFVNGLSLRLPLYACLTLNPFMLDFFVAARGYSLAVGFLTTALVSMCQVLVEKPAFRGRWLVQLMVISACLGFGFTANFSFAFVLLVSCSVFVALWSITEFQQPQGRLGYYAQAAAALIVPAPLIVAAVAGWTLLHWPKGQLVAGSTSVSEMWETFLIFTFSDLNRHVLSAYLFKTLRHWRKALPWLLISLCLLQIAYVALRRQQWRHRLEANRAALITFYLGAVVVLTFLLHWLALIFAGLLLPKDRTSIYFVALCLMVVGSVASFPHLDFVGRALRWATVALLIVGSVYFIGCLRFRYFLLWRFDADMQETYQKLVSITGPGRHVGVPSNFYYTSALNYYRQYFHDDSFSPFWLYDNPERAPNTHYLPYDLNRIAYVLIFPEDKGYVAEHHLKVVYQGPISNVAIAVP